MVDFLVIGPFNSLTYNSIFELIKDGDVGFGWNRVSDFDNNNNSVKCRWFSNISDYYPPPLVLSKRYDDGYKKFDNYDAINIDRIKDIPGDYMGLIGVPITFLDSYNKRQFDIVGFLNNGCRLDENGLQGNNGIQMTLVGGVCKYFRILIKKK